MLKQEIVKVWLPRNDRASGSLKSRT